MNRSFSFAWILVIAFFYQTGFTQQNTKLVFPQPMNAETSSGSFALNAADGGFLLLGYAGTDGVSTNIVPRIIRLNAQLQTQWDRLYLQPTLPHGARITPSGALDALDDNGWLVSTIDDSTDVDLVRIDDQGELLWTRTIPEPYSDFTLTAGFSDHYDGIVKYYGNGANRVRLLHLDANGETSGQVELPFTYINIAYSFSLVQAANGDITAVYAVSSFPAKQQISRFDVNGNLIWQTQPFNFSVSKIALLPGGGFVALKNNTLVLYNDLGEEGNQSPVNLIPNTSWQDISVYPDGSYLVSGHTVANRGFLAKIGADFSVLWVAEAPEDAQPPIVQLKGLPTPDGWAAGVGTTNNEHFGFVRVQENSGLFLHQLTGKAAKDDNANCMVDMDEAGVNGVRIHATNGLETFYGFSQLDGSYSMFLPAGDFTLIVDPAQPFFFVCPDADLQVSFAAGANGSAVKDLPVQSLETIHYLEGALVLDENDNCLPDAGEPPLTHWKITVAGLGETLTAFTNANGQYSFFLPDGDFTLTALPLNPNFGICSPASRDINLNDPTPQTVTADFTGFAATDCGYMQTALSASPIRPCTTAVIQAKYQNAGAALTEGAALTVLLDPLLNFEGAYPAPAQVNGQALYFELGDIPPMAPGDWRSINIYITTDCNLQMGNQVCVTAEITPNTTCIEDPEWLGAIVSVDGECQGDQAVFKFRNIGTAPNAVPRQYVIAEDQIVLLQGNFQLNPGDSLVVPVPYNDLPLMATAQQEVGFPGDTSVIYTVTNCVGMPGGGANVGGGPAGPFVYQACYNVTTSFDPNDKAAQPLGYGEEHIVRPGTELEYTLRFQNTGTDTAFVVVLRDTLSSHLDPTTIRLRGASHPYTVDVLNNGVLQFRFDNILLPDSTTNLEASQGYVSFAIKPRSNLPLGTVVGNQAAIYFDYNAPVLTNTVWRKFDNYLVVSVDTPRDESNLPAKVYPNPFRETAVIELPAGIPDKTYRFVLTNLLGEVVQSSAFTGARYQVNGRSLAAGVYAWQILTEGSTLASGRLVVE